MNTTNPVLMRSRRLILAGYILALAVSAAGAADEVLRAAVIVSRHGVRSPLFTPEQLAEYSAEPWPKWDVPAGYLTAHGKHLAELMGQYYRQRYMSLGLLTGRAEADRQVIFFRTNNIQRTQETGRGLAQGLIGEPQPDLHLAPANTTDQLFTPGRTRLGNPDVPLAMAAERARMGPDPDTFVRAYHAQLVDMDRILFGDNHEPLPPGKVSLLALPVTIEPGKANDLVTTGGALSRAMTLTENFALEYEDGRPASEVGWGRVTRETLGELFQLHALNFDLAQRTLYPAQVESSNLASHVLHTLEQAMRGAPVAGATGTPQDKITIFVGHDTNIANLSGMMGATWSVDGLPQTPTLPAGALVFELWERDHQFYIRTYYISQTLDQMRTGESLVGGHPPAIAAVFIPGSSTASHDYESPWDRFAAHWQQVIDPRYVTP